jgi:CBS domain-containing protein
MRVKEVMTREVATVSLATTLKDAATVLAERRISGLPVIDGENHVLGVISESDILRADLEPGLTTVAQSMSAPAVTIGPNRPVSEAAAAMVDRNLKRLPVVGDDGTLIGILTRADLVRAFIRSDEEVEREIREDVIQRTLWLDPGQVSVQVHDGEVQLSGQVDTKSDAELIPTFVQRVPGVTSVLSKLRWRAA